MLHIADKLAVPRFSRNGNLYFPEELERFDGAKIDLRWMHMGEKASIGYATTRFNKSEMNVYYDAFVTNAEAEAIIRKNPKKWKTSLGAVPLYDEKICHPGTGKCYNAPIGLSPKEMSIVDVPGIPEAGLTIVESETLTMEGEIVLEDMCSTCVSGCLSHKPDPQDPKAQAICFSECPCKKNTSNECNCKKSLMADKTPEQLEAEKKEAQAALEAKMRSELEAKIKSEFEAKAKKEADEKAKAEADAKKASEEAKAKEDTAKAELDKRVKEQVASEIAKLQTEIKEKYTLKTEAAKTAWVEEGLDSQLEEMKKILTDNYARIEIDLQKYLEAHTHKTSTPIVEGVSTSGTIPGVSLNSDIVILPGGVHAKPIRQWCEFQEIPQGDDTIRFYTINIPAFGTITETVNTDITPATHALTSIDVTANTVRGFRQVVKKTEIEKYPVQLLNKIRDTARIRAIQDEANIVLTTAGSTANDFGANHFSGSDGTAVTTTTLEDATGEFDPKGITRARQRLEEQAHDVSPGNYVIALHPRAFRTLAEDADIVRYVQQGMTSISTLGRMEMYFGAEILVTTNLETQNNSYRNIMWIKNKAFAIAAGRTLELEFFKDINKQNVSIVATHRIGAGILDATAYCIISSKAD